MIESENIKKLLTEAYETDPHVVADPSVRLEASRPDVYKLIAKGSLNG